MQLCPPSRSAAILSTLVIVGSVFLPWPTARLAAEQTNLFLQPREIPRDAPGIPALPTPGAAPAAQIQFGPHVSIQANVDGTGGNIVGDAANETSIAVDPLNPNHIAIGWRQFDTIASDFRQAGWAYSKDGGRSWTFPGVIEPGIFRSDPVLTFDTSGMFYYSSLKVVGNDFTVDVFKSTDGGMTWGDKTFAWGGDKQWLEIDRTDGLGHGNIYQAWNVFASTGGPNTFNRSTDGGISYSSPSAIPSTPIFGTLDVSLNGEVYVSGVDPNSFSTFYVARSTNAQNLLIDPTFDLLRTVNMGGSMIWNPGNNSPNPGGIHGQVTVAADRSDGFTSGNLYMLCTVDPPGVDPADVKFTRSTDGGDTWSQPVRINKDPALATSWQWFGTMSVAPNGRIDVIWNDTRFTASPDTSVLMYSFSIDGGLTWSPNEQISPSFDSHLGWPQNNKLGDYYHMISDRVGVHLAWAATFNGEQDVYYLRIGDYDCNSNGVGDSLDIANGTSYDGNQDGIPDECQVGTVEVAGPVDPDLPSVLIQIQPNPFRGSTTIRFRGPGGHPQVRLRVLDVRGRLVRTLYDDRVATEFQSVGWDGRNTRGERVPAGMYLLKMDGPEVSETQKVLMLK